jgi:hypothetical protein
MRARASVVAALVVAGMVAGCDVPVPTDASVQPGLVVFGVLNPASAEQVVLLMRSREAVPDTTGLTFVSDDPIVSAGETPVTGARVVLYAPTGDSAVAVEDRVRRTDRLGAGVYRIWSAGGAAAAPAGAYLPLGTGQRYRLRVASSVGEAEGTARIPSADRIVSGASRVVSLARDSVILPELGARAAGFVYSLRGGNGTSNEGDPQYRRVIERRLVLPSGNDDWAVAFARGVLRGGTRHTLTVTAADTNYFEYYGSQVDPFADRTGRTTLRGAAGVFGATLTIYTQPITIALGAASTGP